MSETTKTVLVIRFLDDDGEYVYVSGVNDTQYTEMFVHEAYDLEDAQNFEGESEERLIEICEAFQRDHDDKDCEVVRITTKTTVEDIMENNDVFKELRIKNALAKLSEKEIRALNLVSTAVYIKTKFHNA